MLRAVNCPKWCWLVPCFLLFHSLASADAGAQPNTPMSLTLVSDQYCPYTCAPEAEQEGYIVALVRGMLEPEGFVIEYRTLPWTRALRSAYSGLVDGLLGVSKAKAKDLLLSPIVGVDSLGFMTYQTHFEAAITEQTLNQLDGARIAQVSLKDFDMTRAFDRYLSDRVAKNDGTIVGVSGENTAPQMVKMLLAGRVDVVAENPQVLAYTASMLGQQGVVSIQGNIEVRNLYVAFKNNDAGRRAVEIMARELPLWRQSGRLSRLMKNYGLKDWLDYEALESTN